MPSAVVEPPRSPPAYRPAFDIAGVVAGRVRLTEAQLLELYRRAPLADLGRWAGAVSQRLHPEDYRTYVIDRNINYTNICTARCTFCAFKRNDPERARRLHASSPPRSTGRSPNSSRSAARRFSCRAG